MISMLMTLIAVLIIVFTSTTTSRSTTRSSYVIFVAADTVTADDRTMYRNLNQGLKYGDSVKACFAIEATNNPRGASWDLATVTSEAENTAANAEASGGKYRLNVGFDVNAGSQVYRIYGVETTFLQTDYIHGQPAECATPGMFCASDLTGITGSKEVLTSDAFSAWRDGSPMDSDATVMCKKDIRGAVFGKMRYRLIFASVTWEKARLACGQEMYRGQYGRLALADTWAKKEFLLTTFGGDVASFWVDGTDTWSAGTGQWAYPSAFFQGIYYQVNSGKPNECLYGECPWDTPPISHWECALIKPGAGLITDGCNALSSYVCEFYDAAVNFFDDHRLIGAIGKEQHTYGDWLTTIDAWATIPSLGKIRMATPQESNSIFACYHTQPGNAVNGEITFKLFVNLIPDPNLAWMYDVGGNLEAPWYGPATAPSSANARATLDMLSPWSPWAITDTTTTAGVCWEIDISILRTTSKQYKILGMGYVYADAVNLCSSQQENGLPGRLINGMDEDSRGVLVHHQNLLKGKMLNMNLHAVGNMWIHAALDRALLQYDATTMICLHYPCRWNGTSTASGTLPTASDPNKCA